MSWSISRLFFTRDCSREHLNRGRLISGRLTDLHIDHFTHEKTDAIESSDNWYRKYIRRILFKRLPEKQAFTSPATDRRPLSIWPDDFQHTNILVNSALQTLAL